MAKNDGSPSANIYAPLAPIVKQVTPNATQRKKRFARIRKTIEGKR